MYFYVPGSLSVTLILPDVGTAENMTCLIE